MWNVLLDSFLDTLKILPILYLVYLLVSYLGHNNNNKYAKLMNKARNFGPLIGGITGCVPQCGFSVVMADLYSKKAITIGTLIAVMLATSDEAIPLMITNFDYCIPMLILIAIKLGIAIIFGYLFDLTLRLFKKKQDIDTSIFNKVHNHDCELTSCSHVHVVHNEDEHKHKNCVDNIFLDALLHTLQIAGFLFIATFIIGLIVENVGIENISFSVNKFVEPLITGLIGLIPSCASSVFLVEFYMAGGISFGAMLAGLCAGSGIGIVVLFTKNRKHIWTNLFITLSLYVIGVGVGMIANIFY